MGEKQVPERKVPFLPTFLILEQTIQRQLQESGGVVMYLLLTGGSVHRGGWNLPSRFLEKLGGYPRKQKAQAEFPNMRGDDFRPLRLQHRGEATAKCGALRDFFCFVLQWWEFLVPHMTMVIFTSVEGHSPFLI